MLTKTMYAFDVQQQPASQQRYQKKRHTQKRQRKAKINDWNKLLSSIRCLVRRRNRDNEKVCQIFFLRLPRNIVKCREQQKWSDQTIILQQYCVLLAAAKFRSGKRSLRIVSVKFVSDVNEVRGDNLQRTAKVTRVALCFWRQLTYSCRPREIYILLIKKSAAFLESLRVLAVKNCSHKIHCGALSFENRSQAILWHLLHKKWKLPTLFFKDFFPVFIKLYSASMNFPFSS